MKVVTPQVDLPSVEREMLAAWDREKVFEASNAARAGAREYSFYDGPPFANGLPHYGHLLANTIKDCVPRYWNMRGFHVDRRFGWDCHGVPVEYEIEKKHQLGGHADVMAMGVGKFNELCRASVQHYVTEWRKTITRLGRWVDWDNQYRTMDPTFMESVWWVFSELNKKGLVYRDYKVVPYSPRIATVLSNFEANQNYKDTQDPALTVKFRLKDAADTFILAWTTTPWTLISNLALCVGPEISYVKVRDLESKEAYWLAEERLAAVFASRLKKKPATDVYLIEDRKSGNDLTGLAYEPLFPFFAGEPGAFRVLADDYVSTSDGTGIVHMAPAYGEDDFRVCRAAGIGLVDPVDESGLFRPQIGPYQGLFVKDADKEIIKDLKAGQAVFEHATLVHSYPFCERTDQPLIYKAIPAWYVAVESFKDRLVANNQTINWVPEHLRDGRMGKWLENAKDWAISRNRFWGTPLPIWVSTEDENHYRVIGSVAELESLTGGKVTDLHKHFIDDLTFRCPDTGHTMRRVSEVFDCWFESGSMPYAQLHFPFENRERFEGYFPADFIAEGLDQTRGWFYTLSVLSTALYDRPAFKNVIVNGIICDETGKKMSKRHRNYTPPDDLVEKYGADSVRLYMLNSSILKGENLIFSDVGVRDTTRMILLPLWNAYSFLSTYAAADGWRPSAALAGGGTEAAAIVRKSTHHLDRWISSRLHTLLGMVEKEMHSYELYRVVPHVLKFIDELTNWYIRMNRRRFWGGGAGDEAITTGMDATHGKSAVEKDAVSAYETLFYVLSNFVKVFAPFAPFTADDIYRNMCESLSGVPGSVHLCSMPQADDSLIDTELEREMSLAQLATELGRSIRAKHNLKTRQVLPTLTLVSRQPADRHALQKFDAMIRGELNVKKLEFSADEGRFVQLTLKPNLKLLGPRLGKLLGTVKVELEKAAADQGTAFAMIDTLEKGGVLTVSGHQIVLADVLIERAVKGEGAFATQDGVTVILDTRLTPELIREGIAREYINRIQNGRKDQGLQVADRIRVSIAVTSTEHRNALTENRAHIEQEVLALRLDLAENLSGAFPVDIDGENARIFIEKA